MLKLSLKKNTEKESEKAENTDALTLSAPNDCLKVLYTDEKEAEKALVKPDKKSKGKKTAEEDFVDEFPDLADLMNIPLRDLKEEFFVFQIKKLMSKLGRVIVRYNLKETEIEKIFLNSEALTLGGITVSPVYIPTCAKLVRKRGLHSVCVTSLIDFPFGESSFRSKMASVKESVKAGVDEVSIMMPTLFSTAEHVKLLKKQAKKIGKIIKGGSGIAINATDMEEEHIKRLLKVTAKTKINAVTFVFGEVTMEELKTKLTTANKFKGKKKIFVLANVDSAEGVATLFRLGVDRILTPYADEIGIDLVERFHLKSIKVK